MLLKLREALRTCSNKPYRLLLRKSADTLDTAISMFTKDPSTETLMVLNGAWVNALRVYNELPPEGSPSPLGGDTTPAKLAEAA